MPQVSKNDDKELNLALNEGKDEFAEPHRRMKTYIKVHGQY